MKKFKINKIKLILIISLIVFFFSNNQLLAQDSNLGFTSSNIWYSQDPFYEGDNIKIYTIIFNQGEKELHGDVTFFDKITVLGKKDFILKSGESKIISIDWIVSSGSHTIFAKITNSRFLISKDQYEEVSINENESEKSEKIVIKKIIPDLNKVENEIKDKAINTIEPIKKIETSVVEKTPEMISKPLINTIDALEKFREGTAFYALGQKEEIKKELEKEKKDRQEKIENKIELKDEVKTSKEEKENILKPFKYAKMFFFALFSFLLGSKIIFYLLIFAILFSILRFIWVKFF